LSRETKKRSMNAAGGEAPQTGVFVSKAAAARWGSKKRCVGYSQEGGPITDKGRSLRGRETSTIDKTLPGETGHQRSLFGEKSLKVPRGGGAIGKQRGETEMLSTRSCERDTGEINPLINKKEGRERMLILCLLGQPPKGMGFVGRVTTAQKPNEKGKKVASRK